MKVNKEIIEAIVTEVVAVGQSQLKIAEYLKELAKEAPGIEEVLPPVGKAKTPKAPKAAVIEPEEVDEDEVDGEEEELDLAGMTLKELKALADENEIEYPSKVKKDALIELLEAAMEDSDEEEEADEEEEEAAEEDEEEIDLEEMSVEELKSFIEENLDGVEVPKKKKTQKADAYKAALIALIEENLGEEEEEEEADEEETDEDEVSTVIETEDGDVDLAELNLKQLKKFAKDYEIEISAKDKEGIIEEILEAIYADDEDAEEAEEEEDDEEEVDIAEELGLNDMSTEELAEILEEHELSTKGKKQALIARIVEAVEDGTIEMDDEEEGE